MGICEGWVGDLGTPLSMWCWSLLYGCAFGVHDASLYVPSITVKLE